MKVLVISLFAMYLCFSTIHAVQVIQKGPDRRMEAWSQFGENLGKSMGQGINDAYRKKQEEQERISNVKNQIFIMDILNSWTIEKHFEYVSRVQNSDLPEDLKLLVIYELKTKSKNY